MPPPARQDPKRFDDIEVGDSVTYKTYEGIVEIPNPARFAKQPGQKSPPYYLRILKTYEKPIFPSGKVIGKEHDGWLLKPEKKSDPKIVVTRATFWALRKAPGKGKTAENRFATDDAVVSCQICGGQWLGNTGRVPHHGYTRPGFGAQTRSCPGALAAPYAVIRDTHKRVSIIARDTLPGVIASCARMIQHTEDTLEKITAGLIELRSSEYERQIRHPNFYKPDDRRLLPIQPGDARYAERQRHYQAEYETNLTLLRSSHQELQDRYDTWQPGGTADVVNVEDCEKLS